MKMRRIAVSALLLVFVFGATPVLAQDEDVGEDETRPTLVNTLENNEDRAAEREARIVERKAELESRLDEQRESILVRKCEAAQTRISSLADRVDAVKAKRERVYNNISTKLDGFLNRLSEAGADVTEVTSVVDSYKNRVTEMTTAFDNYLVALRDLAAMECTDDPEGFEATLQEARGMVEGLKNKASTLHNYLKQEVKNAFKAAIEDLQAANDAAAESDTNQESEE